MAPIAKKRKVDQLAELNFDPAARQDYLSGFRKRKLERQSQAKEQAKRLEREEKIKARQELREQRKEDLVKHLADVDAILKKQRVGDLGEEEEAEDAEGTVEEEWAGFEEPPKVDGTDEYVDEDKYTTVTIQEMGDPDQWNDSDGGADGVTVKATAAAETGENGAEVKKKRVWTKEKPKNSKPKIKKKKFTYETKAERQKTKTKQKAKNSAAAKKRRGDE